MLLKKSKRVQLSASKEIGLVLKFFRQSKLKLHVTDEAHGMRLAGNKFRCKFAILSNLILSIKVLQIIYVPIFLASISSIIMRKH